MKIKKILSQHRRDFSATMECEHCGHEELNKYGYDDSFYHSKVIPEMVCGNCNKKSSYDYRPLTTKYPDHVTI